MSTLPASLSVLSVAEKCELIEALWADLEGHSLLSVEQAQELERRVAAYERDPSDVIPWETIRSRMRTQ